MENMWAMVKPKNDGFKRDSNWEYDWSIPAVPRKISKAMGPVRMECAFYPGCRTSGIPSKLT